jgi:ABC-type branched-subunit amino acid transport system ATPase component
MGFTCLCLLGHAWLRRRRLGRALRVAAASAEAALTLGLSPGRLRFIAFTAVAAGTGVAGALYVPVLGFVSPYAFRVDLSIFFFFSVIIGGQGRLLGPVVGTWILYLVPNVLLVDLALYRLHGLVGPNGSGKTTLLNAISGLIRLDKGSITINGARTTGLPPHAIARLGVGRTFQTPRVFEDMSIWDNIRIGADAAEPGGASWVLSALEQQRPDWEAQRPDLVPHAQRRLLEVLRVTASQPGLLLLDEPAAGLSPEERRNFVALLRVLRDRLGMTIVLIEHDLKLVWQIADRITVLDAGRIVAEGAPQDIMHNPKVRSLFTGAVQDA